MDSNSDIEYWHSLDEFMWSQSLSKAVDFSWVSGYQGCANELRGRILDSTFCGTCLQQLVGHGHCLNDLTQSFVPHSSSRFKHCDLNDPWRSSVSQLLTVLRYFSSSLMPMVASLPQKRQSVSKSKTLSKERLVLLFVGRSASCLSLLLAAALILLGLVYFLRQLVCSISSGLDENWASRLSCCSWLTFTNEAKPLLPIWQLSPTDSGSLQMRQLSDTSENSIKNEQDK